MQVLSSCTFFLWRQGNYSPGDLFDHVRDK
jgi:hypothetical protein